jgi:hypothetical protein
LAIEATVISQSHELQSHLTNSEIDSYLESLNEDNQANHTNAPHGLEEIANDVQATQQSEDQDLQASDYLPEPLSIKQIYKLSPKQRDKWLNAIRKEATTIVENSTFILDDMPTPGEQVIPLKTVFKTKINADGSVNKLKARIVARGDLQKLKPGEDTWSPTASIRLLKAFVACAAQEGKEIKQIDFIAAFLQAKVRERVFVKISDDIAKVCPEYAHLCGRPLRLAKGLYGLTLCGKYWHHELSEHLKESRINTHNKTVAAWLKQTARVQS